MHPILLKYWKGWRLPKHCRLESSGTCHNQEGEGLTMLLQLLNLRIHDHGHVIRGFRRWSAVTAWILNLRLWLQHSLLFLKEGLPWAQTLWEVTLSS